MYNPDNHNVITSQATPNYPPFFPDQGGNSINSNNRPFRPEGITPEMPIQTPPFQMGGPEGNNGNGMTPLSPPPQNIPTRNNMARAVDSGSIRNCVGRFTYVWLDNGNEFWMFPLQVGRNSVSGFRWNRNFGWVYFGVALNRIDFFTCV